MSLLTAIVETPSSVYSSFPAAFERRHLKSDLGLVICRCIWAEVANLQLGKVSDEVFK